MFVEVSVAAAVLFNFKASRKTTHGLTAEMSNYCFGSEEDGAAGIANAAAEIHLFAGVKKLLIESAKTLKQFAAKNYAAARLPVDGALGITLPPTEFFLGEERRKFGEAKCNYPITQDRRETSCRNW